MQNKTGKQVERRLSIKNMYFIKQKEKKYGHKLWLYIFAVTLANALGVASVVPAMAQSDVKFNEGVRYSQWVINSRMNDFYANTTKCGFAVYNQEGTQTSGRTDGKTSLDYVVGLVAKSIIEASQYYSQFDWAQSFAKPWFLSIQNYGDNFYSKFGTSGGSLDDLNAVKLFLPLRELSATTGKYADAATYGNTTTALNNAIAGLKAHNTSYSIKSGTTAETAGKAVAGGWWHKSTYQNQMWLDGSYMGPALFAQLVNYSGKTNNIDATDDWNLIVKQFTILHDMCWNSTEKLPYHAFAADGGTNSASHSDTWEGLSSSSPYVFHSATYWGRAVGWYFLALVDILEQMDKAGLSSSKGYTTLKGYLAETAEGLAKYQDETGGWYQILDKTSAFSASEYNNGQSHSATANYIESSATALFTAAYLKAIRLKYLDEAAYKTVAVNGYKCLVNNFFSLDSKGNVNIFGSCRSAGLGGSGNDYKAGAERFRDGSKAYYLLGYDVAKVEKSENVTEGKVLGAFILAATEYERLYQGPMLLSQDLNKSYTINAGEAISVEVLGDGTASYQWYSTEGAVAGETNASFTPAASGSYYCIINVTPNSTSAKSVAKAASLSAYTITTNTAEVTVNDVSTGEEENAGNVGNSTTTIVTEVVTFPNTTLTYTMTPADATKIEVSATGTGNNNSYLLTGYTGYVKMDSDGSLSLSIPENATNINVTLLSQCSVNSLKLNGDSKTSTTWNGNNTDGYTYSFKIDDSLAGQTYTIKKGDGTSYIHKITITYSLGSSKSNNASATFTYNDEALSFTENVATINLESSQANSSITVNAAPAAGATIATSSENTSISDNVITITAPAAGSNASYEYTVTAEDGTTTKPYTINVTVAAPVLYTVTFNAGTNGTCSTASLTQESQDASITLPDVTANEGYTFDGWYTAEGGNKVESPYTPTANTTLYAHYSETPSGGETSGGETTVKIDNSNRTDEDVTYTISSGTSWNKDGYYSVDNGATITVKAKEGSTISLIKLTYTAEDDNRVGGSVSANTGSYTLSGKVGTWTGSANEVVFTTTNSARISSIEVTYLTGPAINIATQPVDATFAVGTSEGSISVSASTNNGKACTYQWYRCKDTSKTNASIITGATNASYSPDKATAGTYYYYCEISADDCTTVTTDVVTVTIKRLAVVLKFTDSEGNDKWEWNETETETKGMPTFNQPTLKAFVANEDGTASESQITIDNAFSSKVKYISDVTSVAIVNDTTGKISPVESGNGEAYIYAKFAGNESYEPAETFFAVNIIQGYSLKIVNGDAAPAINSTKFITDGENNLVKITFGGWKYNDGTYTVNGESYTDSWNAATKQSGVSAFDKYDAYIIGVNDAKDEKREASTNNIYGNIRYGWFKSPETIDGNLVTYPYTLPVRGSFMTFESTKNGTLTVYILQNGAWNVFDSNTTVNGINYKKGDIKPGEFRPHTFHVVNQRGVTVSTFSPLSFKAATKQKVAEGYKCIFKNEEGYDAEDQKNVVNWTEFTEYLSQDEQKKIHDSWSNDLGYQSIVELDNGSFLAIQKGIVKYTFFVTANETYYLFSNFSKIGFAGANFVPSTTLEPTDEITLSDTEAYPTVTKVSGDKDDNKNKYAWKFGEEIKGYVPGFTIPLFKKISVNRSFTAGQWTTLTLPFNLTEEEVESIFGSGTELLTLDNVEKNGDNVSLHFLYHEIQNILPGQAYLIKPANTVTTIEVNDKAINPNVKQQSTVIGNYTFKGVDGYSTAKFTSASGKTGYSELLDAGDIFVSDGNGKLYISKGSSYVKGYRAYIDYTGGTPAKSINMDYSGVDDSGESTTTSISISDLAPDVFDSLQLNGVYNIGGQRVADTTEGLPAGMYIKEGKKIIVK